MYAENRVATLATRARSLGLNFRAQVIGSDVNSGVAASYADISAGDNSQDFDGWRNLATARDMASKRRLSDEAATFVGGSAHVATWRGLFYMLQRDYAVGVNQAVIHGFSYADASGATWPGFSAFGRAIGNDWGPRDPLWAHATDAAEYLSRVQRLLQPGRGETDVAIINCSFGSGTLRNAGYTYQFPAQELLTRADLAVRNGRLTPGIPNHRALIINEVDAVDLDPLEAIIGFAQAGLAVVVVGRPPHRDSRLARCRRKRHTDRSHCRPAARFEARRTKSARSA